MAERTVLFRYLIDSSQAESQNAKVDKQIDESAKKTTSAYAQAVQKAEEYRRSVSGASGATAQAAETLQKYEVELLQTRSDLAQLNQRIVDATQQFGRNSTQVKELRAEYAQQSAAARALSADKAILSNQIDNAGNAFQQLTTRVNVGRGSLQGYDAIIEAVIRSMGGITLAWSIAIGLASALIPVIFRLGSAKKEQVEVDQQAIALSAVRARLAVDESNVIGELSTRYQELTRQKTSATLGGRAAALAEDLRQTTGEALKFRVEVYQNTQQLKLFSDANLSTSGYAGVLRDNISRLTPELDKSEKQLSEQTEAFRVMYNTLGFQTIPQFEQWLKLNGATPASAAAVSSALQNESSSFRQVASDAINAAKDVETFTGALFKLRLSKRDTGGTSEGLGITRNALNQRLAEDEALGKSVQDVFLANQSAIQNVISNIEKAVRTQVTLNKETLTQAELQQRVKEKVGELNDLFKKYGDIALQYNQTTNNELKKQEAAARSYANTLNELTKKAQEAQAALLGNTFAQREAKIRADAEAQRRSLEINNKDRAAALAQIAALERAQLDKLTIEKLEAASAFSRELTRIQIESLTNEHDKSLELINLQVTEKRIALEKQFGATKDTEAKVNQFKLDLLHQFQTKESEAYIDQALKIRKLELENNQEIFSRKLSLLNFEFDRESEALIKRFGQTEQVEFLIDKLRRQKEVEFLEFRANEEKKYNEQRKAQEIRFQEELLRESAATGRGSLTDLVTRLKEIASLRREFERSVRSEGITPQVDTAALNQALLKLKQLGLTYDDVARRAGNAALDVKEFNKALDRIAAIEKGGFGNILANELGLVFNKFTLAISAAQSFAGALQDAFVQSIAYGKNFVEVFGKTLLAGILSAIGQHAIAEGTYHILAGTAKLFNPFTAAAGAKEIAAGAALVAFGSALVGAATAIQGSLSKNNGGASQQGAAGASASGAGASSNPVSNPPTVISLPVPTSGKGGGTVINLDPDATRGFMTNLFEKNQVLTADNIGRKNRSKVAPVIKSIVTA